MHTQNFARAKIQPPRSRPGLIARDRVDHPLAAALATQRLVLISAPAGFGKTAALTRQISMLAADTALAWVAADADDDLCRLAGCLFAALDPFDLPWRSAPEALVAAQDGSRGARQSLASDLLNALDVTEVKRGLMVIDDAHRIEDPAVFDWLNLVVERLPAHWGLVLSSRVDPPLALARWRAAGELAEFRQDALRFDHDEVRQLIENQALQAPGADAGSLLQRTQGWAAGLSLALSARQQGGGALLTTRHMFDYLASEVLDQMPEALRIFLLRCSVLPELTPARCQAVSGDPQADLHLEELERRGLFVSVLDEAERTLCVHDLFRDFLDDRLRRERPAELVDLLKRAAGADDDPARRIGYLLRAGAWEEAERVLFEVGGELLTLGAASPVQHFIEQFPAEFRSRAPLLQLVLGWVSWVRWDWPAMCEATRLSAEVFAQRGDPAMEAQALSYHSIALSAQGDEEGSQRVYEAVMARPVEEIDLETRCRAMLAACWHALYHGERYRVSGMWSELVDGLEQLPSLARWYECSPLTTFIGMPGMRAPLQRYVAGVFERTPEGPTPLGTITHTVNGWLQLWAGDLVAAEGSSATSIDYCRWLGWPPNQHAMVRLFWATLLALRGRHLAANAVMAELIAEMADTRRPQQRAFILFHAVRVAAVAEDDATLLRMAALLGDVFPADGHPMPVDQRMPLPAHLAMAEGRLEQACAYWEQALAHEERIDVFGQAIESRVRLADALLQRGLVAEAAGWLLPVFARVADSGECGGVLMAGPRVLARLAAHGWGKALPEVAARQLEAWARLTASWRAGGEALPSPAQPAAALLSAREMEVLSRIAAGESNKLIARAFDLSPHTVKRHVANIFDKLGLSSRGQAAAWLHARQRGGAAVG